MTLEGFHLLGYKGVLSDEIQPTFQRNMPPPPSEFKDNPSKREEQRRCQAELHATCFTLVSLLVFIVDKSVLVQGFPE
jgi:hypothetical protein